MDPNPAFLLQAPTVEGGRIHWVLSKDTGREVASLRDLAQPGIGGRASATPKSTTGASRRQRVAGAAGARAVGALPGAGPGARGRERSWESRQGPRVPARGAQT